MLARRRRPSRGNRSRRRLARKRGRPAAATRDRTRARVDATTRLRASFTYRVVLLILVGSTPLDRVRAREDASTRLPEPGSQPGVDFVDPPRRRHSRVRRGGYSSRTTPRRSGRSPITDRSIVHLRSSPPPRVARRSEGVGGECVINRFAARPLGSPSRRRRRVASSSSSRDAAARGLVLVERSFVLLFLLIATAASALLDPSARRPVASVVWCPGT